MKKTENFQVTGLAAYSDNISHLAEHNPDYDLSEKELIDTGRVGERIFETVYHPEEITVREQEEGGPVLVYADGEIIGTVLNRQAGTLRKLLAENRFTDIRLSLQGGPYKILLPEGEADFTTQRDIAGLYAFLQTEYEEHTQEAATLPSEESSFSYISTTYETAVLEEDPGKRGRGCLYLALLLGGGVLTFFGLYWWFVRSGRMPSLSWLGGDLPNTSLYPHLGLAGGALVLAILALFTKNAVLPLLSALCWMASCYFLPGYTIFFFFPALFCGIAALRRKSKGVVSFFKILTFFAVLGLSGWFLKDTAQNFFATRHFTIMPTWHFDPNTVTSVDPLMEDDGDWIEGEGWNDDDTDWDEDDDANWDDADDDADWDDADDGDANWDGADDDDDEIWQG